MQYDCLTDYQSVGASYSRRTEAPSKKRTLDTSKCEIWILLKAQSGQPERLTGALTPTW